MDIAYSEVEQYLLNYEIDGTKIYCEFQKPNGEVLTSHALIKKSRDIKSQVTKKMARMAKQQAKRHAGRFIRGALGGGMLGRLGSTVTRSSINEAGDNLDGGSNFSESEIQEATVKAFSRVAREFGYSRGGDRLKERQAAKGNQVVEDENASEFQKQMNRAPISNAFEQELLARFLVDIAKADGRIDKEEKDFFGQIIPRKMGNIAAFINRDPISKIECEELSDPVKETIYMIGWVLAAIDLNINAEETRSMYEWGDMFGLDSFKKAELAKFAKAYVIESTMEPTTQRSELLDIADALDLERDYAERVMIAYKKRM
jgi:tellurite resistance protein